MKFNMKLPKAHKRLEKLYDEVCEMATEHDVITDVGTDHGYLPVMLAKTGIGDKIIATDISAGSLTKAIDLAQKHGVNVDCRLCDGLALARETTLAIMAGIGGNEIIKIIENASYEGKMVLQPVPTAVDLRKYLVENNFKITKDYVVFDENKFYFVFAINGKGKNNYSKLDMMLGNVKAQKHTVDFALYVKNQINKLSFLDKFDITELTDESKNEIKDKKKFLQQLRKLV